MGNRYPPGPEFEPSAQAIRNWVPQAELDDETPRRAEERE